MEHLTKLFKLVELTRSQPQTGYVLAGIKTDELSNLAEHHYLVTFIAWQLARAANRAGAKLSIEKVLEYAMVHDLGELLGGDISSFYAKANRTAYRAAKAFEAENHKYLSKFFGTDAKHFRGLAKEIMDAKTDEALYAKAADFVECTHYKLFVRGLVGRDLALAREKLQSYGKKVKDPVARGQLEKFLGSWIRELPTGSTLDDMLVQDKPVRKKQA